MKGSLGRIVKTGVNGRYLGDTQQVYSIPIHNRSLQLGEDVSHFHLPL
jgi:hypothetical protein